jgi:all-trans-retinol 13,14-reductase
MGARRLGLPIGSLLGRFCGIGPTTRIDDMNLSTLLLSLLVICLAGIVLFLCLLRVTRWPKARPIEPRRAVRFRPDATPDNIDTIVIGSGSGGSTCANLLAQSGQRVLLLEQHAVTGGCTHSFRQQGCEWDTGLHYASKAMSKNTARPGAIMDFMTEGLQAWTPLEDPYDEILFPPEPDIRVRQGAPNKASYPFFSGEAKMVAAITDNIDPKDEMLKNNTKTFMDICLDINAGFVALGASRILPSWLQFLVKRKVEKLMTYAAMTVRDVHHAVLKLGYSQQQLLDSCPKAPEGEDPDPAVRRLKGVMCHPIGDYAVQPREATMAAHGVTMSHYMDGGSYTVGPTQNISIRMTSMVRSFGGDVFVDATVRDIIMEHGRAVGVRVSNTSALAGCASEEDKAKVPVTEVRANNVVCATSIYNLYGKLLPPDLPVVRQFNDPAERTVRQSNGHLFLFCKIRGDATDLGLPSHNLWYFNRYDLDGAFDDYFANPTEVRPPTVYIGFPCTKDTTWKERFPGVSNCILISDGLYEWFEAWADKPCHHRGADYLAFKDKLTRHLLDILYEFVPQVRGKVEFHHLGTPLTEVSYLASFRGGSYGTQCTPEMFAAINRKWTTSPHTPIPGLYLAGSDAFLPSVTGAMYGGCLGACAVLGHLGSARLARALLSHLAKRLREADPKLTRLQSYRAALDKFING